MVLISSTKYACETCIKGHRSSTCKHTDRPLYEIKKKGRPVTQCEHCRELRKTKQVHVKCVCEAQDDSNPSASSCSKKKVSAKVPESAAFPHGLPQALEASVALQHFAEGTPPEADRTSSCNCKSDGNCNCFTLRKSAPKRRGKAASDQCHDSDDSAENTSKSTNPGTIQPDTFSHILARIAELRPVLPKPSSTGPCHDPSAGTAHTHAGRHHTHDNMFFSPYGRAYEFTHGSHHDQGHDNHSQELPQQAAPSEGFGRIALPNEESFTDQPTQLPAWNPSVGSTSFPSVCRCGDGCACPGCIQHNDAAVASVTAFNSCMNPGACSTCLDCTILSLPASLPPNTALSIYDPYQSQFIDDWLRQVSDIPTSTPSPSKPDGMSATIMEPGYVLPTWETFQLPDNPEVEQVPDPTASGAPYINISPPGVCRCNNSGSHDEHCAQFSTMVDGTFPTSSEGVACSLIMSNLNLDASGPIYEDALDGSEMYPARSVHLDAGGYLTIPQFPRSRSSSGSSHSSNSVEQSRYGQTLDATFPPYLPTELDGGGIYAVSNPDSDGSLDDRYSPYDLGLEGY